MTGGFASSEKTIAAAEYKVGMSGTLVVIAASDLGDGSYDNTQEDFTTTIPASSFVDGVNTIYLRAQDSEGNWGIWTEEEVVYDAAAPSISFDEIPEEVAGTLTLSISTSDNDIEDVVFEYATNNDGTGVWTTIGTDDTVSFNIDWDTTEVPDGEYCVKATATDDVGRTGETSELCFEVDNGVSGVPTLIHPADSSYVSSSPELQWNAVDGAEDYRVIVSDATDYNNKVIDQIVSGTSYDTLSDSLSVETEYYWHVVARDSDGDEGQYSSTWWFIIDSTPPQVSLTSIDGPVSGTIPIEATSTSTDVENVEFRYKETEAGSWTVIGVAENSPYVLDWDTTEVNDGSYDVKAVATDRAGNQASDTMETSFMIDNTAPTATINTAVYGPYNSDPGAVVDVDFADAGAGSDSITAEYKIGSGGSWQTITSCNGVASPCEDDWSVDWADLAEGENTIYMRTTDSLGNSEELVQTLTFVKDTTAPEILFVNPSKGMVTADDFSLLVHTNEDASCEYNLDGETSGDMDTTGSTMHEKSMSGLSDGEHAIAVTCEDLAGNSDTTEALTWIVTNEDAYIASVALDPYYTSEAPDVTARAIHPDNALIEQVEYFIRSIGSNMPSEEEYDSGTDLPAKDGEFNETEEQVEGTLEIEELQDGEYVMYIHAKAGGEWGPFDGELFTLDTTSPEIFDIMPDEDIPGSGEVTAVTVSAKTSEKADCRIIVSEVNYYDMTGDGSVYHKGTIPLLTDGEYSYTIECTDRVGLSNTALVSFEIDSEGPTVTMDDLPEYSLTSFMVSWSGSDSGVGIEGYSVQYKKGGEETWTDWIVDENVVEESYTGDEGETVYFRAKATDRVGNEGAYSSTVSTVIDGAPPTIINSGPSETLDTSDITLFVETNEEASCRYARSPMEYSAMENSLATEDDLYHSVDITGLEEGHHGFYIRCVDVAGNEMAVSEKIEFTVDTSSNYGYVAELTPVWDSFFLSKLILDDLFGPVTHSTEFVLDSLEDEEGDPTYNIVWYFDGTYWRFYNPENEMNTLEEFNDEVSNPYWIKMLQADRLELAEGAST
jgi:hypothetical protein